MKLGIVIILYRLKCTDFLEKINFSNEKYHLLIVNFKNKVKVHIPDGVLMGYCGYIIKIFHIAHDLPDNFECCCL
jgi:hypothetical protein